MTFFVTLLKQSWSEHTAFIFFRDPDFPTLGNPKSKIYEQVQKNLVVNLFDQLLPMFITNFGVPQLFGMVPLFYNLLYLFKCHHLHSCNFLFIPLDCIIGNDRICRDCGFLNKGVGKFLLLYLLVLKAMAL